MRYIIAVFITLLSLTAHGQQITYSDWKEEAKTNIRLLPEYGNVQKTEEQKKADDELIQTSIAADVTAAKASAHLVSLGFTYFGRRDIKTAMYRFNQAWLLDHTNENAYWGFGAVYFSFGDYDAALKMYDRGLALNPKSSKILNDKATIYMAMLDDVPDLGKIYDGMATHKFEEEALSANEKLLSKAIDLLRQSYAIDPHDQNTTFKMSTLYFAVGHCVYALQYYKECKTDGGQPITKEYEDALLAKCK